MGRTQSYLRLTPGLSATRRWAADQEREFKNQDLYLTAKLNLFRGFSDFANIKANAYGVDSGENRQAFLKLDVQRQVSEIYLQCLARQTAESDAKKAYEIRQQVALIAETDFNKGTRGEVDYLRLKIDAENLSVDHLEKSKAKSDCFANLKFWVGGFDQIVHIEMPIEKLKEPDQWDKFRSNLNYDDNPEWHSLQLLAEKRKWESRTSKLSWLPTLDLAYADYPKTRFQPREEIWLLNLTWDIFDSGERWADIQLSNIRQTEADETLRMYKRRIQKDLDQTAEELRLSLAQYAVLEQNLNAAEKIYEVSLNRFRAGSIGANDVALDQTRVMTVKAVLNQAWLDKNTAYVRLIFKQGKELRM